jgi:hypothetical protein
VVSAGIDDIAGSLNLDQSLPRVVQVFERSKRQAHPVGEPQAAVVDPMRLDVPSLTAADFFEGVAVRGAESDYYYCAIKSMPM